MKIAAKRDKDTLDIARLLRTLNITNATDAVDLPFDAATVGIDPARTYHPA